MSETTHLDELNAALLPFAKLIGIRLTHAEADLVRAELTVREEICTVPPTLHGGAMMALADTLGAYGAFLNLEDGASGTTTLESKTNFLGGAKLGAKVVAEARPVHKGRRTQVWQTELRDESGKLLALTSQTQLTL